MKFYGLCPDASMQMLEHPDLTLALKMAMRDTPIDVAVESGTHLGTGSTRFIAEAFAQVRTPKVFYTIEGMHESAMAARRNLAPYPFVKSLWGCSVNIDEAIAWLGHDEALAHPERYPEIWTDHTADAATHYAAEVRAAAVGRSHSDWAGENLLDRLLTEVGDQDPLIILDSAGGIGLLEFTITRDVMAGRPYHLLLDDVGHVKHFRSFDYIQQHSDEFTILFVGSKCAFVRANG